MTPDQASLLDPAVVDELVDRLSEVIVERVVEAITANADVAPPDTSSAWVDAQEVARRLGVSREWVYEHAEELGATRIGNGPRPRLRFPPEALAARDPEPPYPHPPARTSRPAAKTSGLIPIRSA